MCDKVDKIYDIEAMVQKSSKGQRARRRELLLRTTTIEHNALPLATVHRIVSVLSHIDSPATQQALVKLAKRYDELGTTASFELSRKAR